MLERLEPQTKKKTYLRGLYQKIDEHEKVMVKGELVAGIFVNAASVIMRLGVATTILVGAHLDCSRTSGLHGTVYVLVGHYKNLCTI